MIIKRHEFTIFKYQMKSGIFKAGQHLISSARLLLIFNTFILTGCASINGPTEPHDPYERYNRAMYQFNDSLDKAIIKPVAKGYDAVVPGPVRKGITNFFGNLDDVIVLINDILQFKITQAASDTARIVVNSTVGLFGLIDVARPMGLRKHREDFGQTLGRWGIGSGPYLVLPFFGPSSPRDGIGLYVDYSQFDPTFNLVDDNSTRNTMFATDVINTRAGLLSASRILDTASLDPYVFVREAYLQRRQSLVYDGSPPEEEWDEELDEECCDQKI